MKTEIISHTEDEKLLSGDLEGRIDLDCDITPEQVWGLFYFNPKLQQVSLISGYYLREDMNNQPALNKTTNLLK